MALSDGEMLGLFLLHFPEVTWVLVEQNHFSQDFLMCIKMMLTWKKPISLLNAHFEAQLLTIIIIAVIFEHKHLSCEQLQANVSQQYGPTSLKHTH